MDSIRANSTRASLSWRLTTREKQGVMSNIYSPGNIVQLQKLSELLK
jgi:hypothetical protein